MKKCFISLIIVFFMLSQGNSQDRPSLPLEGDSLIVAALAMIDADSLQGYVQSLQDMGTRFMISPNRKEVATWIMNKFLSFGIEEVRLDSFLCYTNINWPPLVYDTATWQYNVEARIQGIGVPEEEVVLLGHYDCVVQDADPLLFAPGADDNASGTAAALECARVIMEMGYQPEQTLIFLASAAEELMYYGDSGTEHYASEAKAAGRNIVMAINNDMIAWNDGSWTIDLFNHNLSPHITTLAINIIVNYTSLNYKSWAPTNNIGGDIQPFLDAGYHGIYFMEHLINPNYHKVTDLVDHCDFIYLAEATKVSIGCILYSDISVGLRESGTVNGYVSVYPNPARDRVNVNLPESSRDWDLKIYDISGRLVYESALTKGSNSIDISGIRDGIHVMTFTNGERLFYHKLIVNI